MKKLIGIILALCMLSTMASAATPTISDENVDQKAMTVSFKYAGIAEGAQATMLAYEVTDAMIKEKAIPDFVDNTTTPIKGIDQEGVDADGFSFKVAEGYTGKIVVKIGGTDMDPVAFLVEFKKATQRVTFIWGDVNSDGYVNDLDGNNILSFYYGGSAVINGTGNFTATPNSISSCAGKLEATSASTTYVTVSNSSAGTLNSSSTVFSATFSFLIISIFLKLLKLFL